MTNLISIEAEEAVIGFLFNTQYVLMDKIFIFALLTPEHFSTEENSFIFSQITSTQAFDKILFWEHCKMIPKKMPRSLTWDDIENIDDFVTKESAESYVQILIDKLQRRQIYAFGESLKDSMVKGEDQFEIALNAQKVLSGLSSKLKVQNNQDLLDSVLRETKDDLISTGYDHLDSYLGGYTRGMIITIAGDSGHMKTTLALDKAFRMAEKNKGLRIGIFSKEMLAQDIMKKQISRICKIPMNKIFAQDYDKEYVKKTMNEIKEWASNRIQIVNPELFAGVTDIARIQMTQRYDVWFLDFIQLLEFSKSAATSSDYNIQIGQNMRNLQALALATRSTGIILSQVKKGIENRKQKKPTVSDIEWSGLIKQLSTYIFFSYYPGKYYGFDKIPADHYYLLGEKTRFAETFTYPMKVDPEFGLFYEVNDTLTRTAMTSKLKQLVG